MNGLVLAAIKAKELKEALGLKEENIFLHTDSLIFMYWVIKPLDKLAVYVCNRVKGIKEAGVQNVLAL